MLPPDIVKQIIIDTVWLRRIDNIKHCDEMIKFYRHYLNIHKQRFNELLNVKNNYKEQYKFKKLFTNEPLYNIQTKLLNIKKEIETIRSNIENLKNNIKKTLIYWSNIRDIPSRYHQYT